jgi:hypothetical protein
MAALGDPYYRKTPIWITWRRLNLPAGDVLDRRDTDTLNLHLSQRLDLLIRIPGPSQWTDDIDL